MKKILMGLFVIVAMVGMISCENSANPLAPAELGSDNAMAKGNPNGGETAYTCSAVGEFAGFNETNDPDYAIYEYTLWAGQHNDAGTVVITNDDENIYVTYNTNETADLGEVHVYIWEDASLIPTKRPAPGHADYVVENINADSYTVVMPVDLSCGNTYYISTHAALVGNGTDGDEAGSGDNAGETAYAGDASSPDCFDATKGAWWGYATYTVECFYDISGSVYEDGNNSSDMEAGEAGFGGIVVNLLDASGAVIASATTAADGSYLFEHVAGGADYSVVVAAGPEGDYLATENAGGFSITGLSADTADVDFGYVPLYDLSGTVYDDANANGDDDGEAGLEGILVTLLDGSGNVVAETYTDANGDYLFENIVAGGDYQIVVGDLAGMDATENAGGFIISGLGSDTSDIDFGYNTPDNNNDGDGDNDGGNNDFPTWGQDISHVVLVFTPASAPNGDPIDDGYYLIKVDNYPDAGDNNLDNDIDGYLAGLVSMGLLDSNYELIGSSIKGGRQVTSFYYYGSYNFNGDAADTPPAGFPLTYDGSSANEGNQNQIDESVDWSSLQ